MPINMSLEYPKLAQRVVELEYANKELLSALDDAESELSMWARSFTEDEDTPQVLKTIRGVILKYSV